MKPGTVFQAAFWGAVLLLPAWGLLRFLQPPHTGAVLQFYLRGRNGTCDFRESLEGGRLARLQACGMQELRDSSRVVARDGAFSLWSTPMGRFWAPSASGEALILEVAEQRRDIYGGLIRKGDIVLDAGANIGLFTSKALAAGAGQVVAIEPAPENLECLRRTFAREIAAGRVRVYPKGIWDKDDVLKMSIDPVNSSADSYLGGIRNAQFVQLPVTTVDRIVRELHLARVDLIKMDIEGAEQRAIAGARNTIASFRPRMALSIYHLPGDDHAIPQLVAAIVPGYRFSKSCLCVEDSIQAQVGFFQ